MFIFVTVLQAIVAATLVILVLMQRSEGGGLGIGGGGSPGGLMSARGAADFLTRATKWSAILFVSLSIVLAALAVDVSGQREFDDTLDRSIPSSGAAAPDEAAPVQEPAPAEDPLADIAE